MSLNIKVIQNTLIYLGSKQSGSQSEFFIYLTSEER